ncbi:MAG: NADH-quinone oxidoreductase subunit C, partial [Candidatus Gastranaerophilales bacterium]|nr:NADH-quinone oxidoreductase subunit C [Candidatus Gastranaerophilales bacterium]
IILPDIREFYINKNEITNILQYLKTAACYLFERLDFIFAKDNGSFFTITYVLNSDKYNIKCAISCNIQYDEAEIKSVEDIYKSANWDEREIYDLFGINFINHSNLKRILLPDDFEGFPMRKNYKMQDERLAWNYE